MTILDMPLVSVGITSYDKPELLYLTIQNIVNQTYKKLEIILALDAPPDSKTIKICESFSKSDPQDKSIHTQKEHWFRCEYKICVK